MSKPILNTHRPPMFYAGDTAKVSIFDFRTKSHYPVEAEVALIMQKHDGTWKYRLSIPELEDPSKRYNQDFAEHEYNGEYFDR